MLLDEESVTKGRDFANTERNFTNTIEQSNDRGRRSNQMPKQQQGYNPEYGTYQPPMVPGNYPNVMMPNNPMGQGYGYPPYQYHPPTGYNMPPPPPPYGSYPPIVPPFDQSKKQQAEKEKQS